MFLRGVVRPGKGEARAIGYPTANLEYQSDSWPEKGIWISLSLARARVCRALTVVGMWENPGGSPSVETHLLDWQSELYGREIQVALLKKIRDLENFGDPAALLARIEKDVDEARKYFSS